VPAVLLIEDDAVLSRVISMHLRHAGFEVELSESGDQGLVKMRFQRPDVVLLDLMLPGLDGWAVTQAARSEGLSVPILAISARAAEHDKVHTLGIGVDDYLAKPFGMRELVARVQALLRRAGTVVGEDPDAPIVVGGLRIDGRQRRAFLQREPNDPPERWGDVGLTPTEFRLLLVMGREAGRAMTRDELHQRAWGTRYRHRDRTVDVCVSKLRVKLDAASASHTYVQTHHGVGYRLAAEPKPAGAFPRA
jgi:DNA-binding response OmpR family regulator